MSKSSKKLKKENNIFLTIFTPTYNRCNTLERLYTSLVNQTDSDFEWIVVDDGSTDSTEKYFDKIKKENKIRITYVKKENEGKHIAINYGVNLAQGKMFFIVDSDDALDKDAVKFIKKYESQINDIEFAGVAGLKATFDKKIVKSLNEYYEDDDFIQEIIDATSVEYRYKLNISGDRAEVVYTKYMKLFPFPKLNNDKFMEESYLWDNLSILKLKFRWFNKKIYLGEYMNNGLSYNMNELLKKNWASHVFCSNLSLSIKEIPLKFRLRFCVRYYRYGIYGKVKIKELYTKSNNKLLSIFAIPISLIKKVK